MAINPLFSTKKIKIEGIKGDILSKAKTRIFIISIFFVMAYGVLIVRSFDLTVIQGDYSKSVEIINETTEAIPRRSNIIDRNGTIVATSLKTFSLYADATNIIDSKTSASDLSSLFPDLSYGLLLQKLQSSRRFVWIKRHLTPDQHHEILQIGDPGLMFIEEDRRVYPQGNLMSHFIGYGDVDGKGLSGLERSFNKFLSSDNGELKTTIDVRIQHILRRETLKAMDSFSGKSASAIMMNVNNGEIIAAISLPDYDPHYPADANSRQLFNNTSLGVYELGSTFKIFSTAAILENKGAELKTKFDTTKPLKRGRYTIRDYHPEDHPLTVPEVFIHSSNIGSALMGEKVGTNSLKDFYADLGLLSPLDLEIGEIGSPIIPNPWRNINTLTASYGHGIAVSPLQLVTAVSSIVNGGFVVKPKLVVNNEVITNKIYTPSDVRIISAQTSHRMRQLMRLVVSDGTGSNAEVKGFDVGGKTGTAEKPTAKGYDKKKIISSFIGVFPMTSPQYAVFIMVDEPKPNKNSFGYATGGWVAAPAVANVIRSSAPILGITPDMDKENIANSLKKYITIKVRE